MNNIAFYKPDVGELELTEVEEVLKSGWLTTGPKVKLFEDKIAKESGAVSAVAVDSCTTALEFTLRVLGIGPGDEVITTPFTYTATADVIHTVGAKIVFVDLSPNSFEMDYSILEEKITANTKAVIAVDYGGILCDYNPLFRAVENKKEIFTPSNALQEHLGRVAVIADSAHSFGASYKGKPSGSVADFTCFSFHVLKPITTGGEGGAICWKNRGDEFNIRVSEKLHGMRHHFQTEKSKENGWEYNITDMGFNRPMTDINAAIGLAQLSRLGEIELKRILITDLYDNLFEDSLKIRPLLHHLEINDRSSFHLYPVSVHSGKINSSLSEEEFRNKVILRMRDWGIPCNVHYKPLPMFTAYKKLGYDIKDYPNAYKRYSSLITLPYHTHLSEEDVGAIVEHLRMAVIG